MLINILPHAGALDIELLLMLAEDLALQQHAQSHLALVVQLRNGSLALSIVDHEP